MWIQLPSPKGAQPPILGHVCCRQTAGWIKMELGTEVGLGPGHTVLDGDPAPPPPKGHSPRIFGPCLLWLNSWVDQDANWHGGRPRPRPLCVRLRPSSSTKGQSSPIFAHICCGQTAGWTKVLLGREVGLGPGHIVLDGDPPPPPPRPQ